MLSVLLLEVVMFRNKSVSSHSFAMVPRSDIPRASFKMEHVHKTSFDAAYLVPIYAAEVLPSDTFNVNMTAFCRLATPIFPFMDNLHLDCFFFFVPNRLVWTNWVKFMGEQLSPGDSTSFLVPQVETPVSGWPIMSMPDYFGLPTEGQLAPAETILHNSLILRGYNLIYNEWFRDENLCAPRVVELGDGPDDEQDYRNLARRGKRHDYFTSCLPWPQKGAAVSMPLSGSAPIRGLGILESYAVNPAVGSQDIKETGGTIRQYGFEHGGSAIAASWAMEVSTGVAATAFPMVYADLTAVSAFTINLLRTSFAIQKLLERDARGGTRYTELVRAHFGVSSPDQRLQRPEYLGGGSTPVSISPVPQTSATSVDSPQGNLAAMGTVVSANNSFTYSATEHGHIIGVVSVRADLTYQQGLNRMWSRQTRFDFHWPEFSHLGEQAVLQKEIYVRGVPAEDDIVFGYQERGAEYRYMPSFITSLMRSTADLTIDIWHLAERFNSAPVLNEPFISDNSDTQVYRVSAVGLEAAGQQFLCDAFFSARVARPMPLYSVPGFIDRF